MPDMPADEAPGAGETAGAAHDRLEPAASGRARCRACESNIEKGSLRFGEELASTYGEGGQAAVFWFHPRCAAQRRCEKILPLLREDPAAHSLPDREALMTEAELGVAHPKLARLAGAERASSGRARCRQCQELIPGGAWRLRLSSFGESGFFDALGFIHASCAAAYFETPPSVLPSLRTRLAQSTPNLGDVALEEIDAAVRG